MNANSVFPSPGLRQEDYLKIKNYLIERIARDMEALAPPAHLRRQAIIDSMQEHFAQARISLPPTIQEQLFKDILDDFLGFGPLQPLLDDPSISEVMINNHTRVYIEQNGKIILTQLKFNSDEEVMRIIEKIVMPLGRHIDADSPMVDARLPDGSRVNAVIPPVSIDGPTVTIRKFGKDKLTIDQLIGLGTLTPNMAEFTRACVISKFNIIVSGGTGTGKTTLLNILSGFIPSNERIITIEDAAELALQQDHVVRMETKPANVEGQNAIPIRELVRNSLRMRPDRIIVGEVRGGEAMDMLQAMNTGHDGSLTTLHANSPRDAISRLETMCMMAGMEMPLKVIRTQIASAIDLIVQLSRLKDGSRKVTAITEVVGMEGDTVVLTDIFKYEQTGIGQDGKVLGELKPTGMRPLFTPRLEANGFKLGADIFGANLSEYLSNRRR